MLRPGFKHREHFRKVGWRFRRRGSADDFDEHPLTRTVRYNGAPVAWREGRT